MPLMCANNATNNDQADKMMDLMHRMITQIAVTQSQIEVLKSRNEIYKIYKKNSLLLKRIQSLCLYQH